MPKPVQPTNNGYEVTDNLRYGFQQEGGQKKALSNPSDVFNQFAQGGSAIPLFKTLGQVGITRPAEQQLFFQYARQHGGYDSATGDFVIPKDKAVQLWEAMKNDKQFQLQLNQVRVKGIDEGIAKTRVFLSDPRTISQMQPGEEEGISQKLSQLTEMKNMLIENIRRLTAPMQAGLLNGADRPGPVSPAGGALGGQPEKAQDSKPKPQTSKFSDFL